METAHMSKITNCNHCIVCKLELNWRVIKGYFYIPLRC